MMSQQPVYLKHNMTHMLPHHDTECQQSINTIWSYIVGNEGFAQMNELITELLNVFIAKNTTYNRKNTDSIIINIAVYTTFKKRSLAVEYLILIIYYYPTAKTGTLYKSSDGPTDNPRNSTGLGDFHWTVSEIPVLVNWQPDTPISHQFGSNPDPDPEWQSRTDVNTRCKDGIAAWYLISTLTILAVWCMGLVGNVWTKETSHSTFNSALSTMRRHFQGVGTPPAVHLEWQTGLFPNQRSSVSYLGVICCPNLMDSLERTIWSASLSHCKDFS